jgi:hypothetical protein
MWRYKWTPFQLLALYATALAVYDTIFVAQMQGEPGLGGLIPYIFLACGMGLFILDVLFQYLLRRREKLFFVLEAVLSIAFVLWIYRAGGI